MNRKRNWIVTVLFKTENFKINLILKLIIWNLKKSLSPIKKRITTIKILQMTTFLETLCRITNRGRSMWSNKILVLDKKLIMDRITAKIAKTRFKSHSIYSILLKEIMLFLVIWLAMKRKKSTLTKRATGHRWFNQKILLCLLPKGVKGIIAIIIASITLQWIK